MIDKDILEGISELNESDLKRLKLLIDNKLDLENQTKVSFRKKSIKCGKEACQTCPHARLRSCIFERTVNLLRLT